MDGGVTRTDREVERIPRVSGDDKMSGRGVDEELLDSRYDRTSIAFLRCRTWKVNSHELVWLVQIDDDHAEGLDCQDKEVIGGDEGEYGGWWGELDEREGE